MKNKKGLSREEVMHVAKLAKLDLTEKEILKFQKQLSAILDFVDQLKSVETGNASPSVHVTNLENVFREDIVTPSLTQEEVLANAKEKHQGFFKVKAVLES